MPSPSLCQPDGQLEEGVLNSNNNILLRKTEKRSPNR
jgi:hypothetical protein